MTAVDFDPFSREFFDDPLPTYARLREEAPCFHSERYDFYAFSRFDDVVAIHRDTHHRAFADLLASDRQLDPAFPGKSDELLALRLVLSAVGAVAHEDDPVGVADHDGQAS